MENENQPCQPQQRWSVAQVHCGWPLAFGGLSNTGQQKKGLSAAQVTAEDAQKTEMDPEEVVSKAAEAAVRPTERGPEWAEWQPRPAPTPTVPLSASSLLVRPDS